MSMLQLSKFHPRKLANCELFLQSLPQYVTLDGSNNASAWQDQGIHNLSLSQSNADRRMAYAANQINGLPGLVGNGTLRYLSNTVNLGTLTGATAYLVVKHNNTVDAQRAYNWVNDTCAFLVMGNFIYFQSDTSGWARVAFTNTNPVILVGRFDASQTGNDRICLRINGQNQTFSSYGSAQPDNVSVQNLWVGAGGSNYLNGIILAAGFYSRALPMDECVKVEQYLSRWSGIALA